MPPEMPPLIEIADLDFAYGRQRILENVHLSVEAGTTLGVIGPNGGGKTTLARLLLGLLRPQRGTIRIAGLAPAQAVRTGRLVGYLPRNPRPAAPTFPLNVRQIVRLGLAGKTGMLRAYDREDLAVVETLLRRVGLAGLADRPVSRLS